MSTETILFKPLDHEAEKASNGYLMSLIAIMGGLPMPIINLLASIFYYLNYKKESLFVRWHCTQAILAQLSVFIFNSTAFYWTMRIIFSDTEISNYYISFIIHIILLNIVEFISTMYTAIQTRKGHHVQMWIFSNLTDRIFKIKSK